MIRDCLKKAGAVGRLDQLMKFCCRIKLNHTVYHSHYVNRHTHWVYDSTFCKFRDPPIGNFSFGSIVVFTLCKVTDC